MQIVSGRVLRVYKHLWSSVREFWFNAVDKHGPKEYIVLEYNGRRVTYSELHELALKAAHFLGASCGVQKGRSLRT